MLEVEKELEKESAPYLTYVDDSNHAREGGSRAETVSLVCRPLKIACIPGLASDGEGSNEERGGIIKVWYRDCDMD